VKIFRIVGEKHEAYSLWDAVTCRETIAGNTNSNSTNSQPHVHNVQENPVTYITLICVMERPLVSPLTLLSTFPAFKVTFMVMTTSVFRYNPDFYLNSTFTLNICSISIAGKLQSISCWRTPGEFDILY